MTISSTGDATEADRYAAGIGVRVVVGNVGKTRDVRKADRHFAGAVEKFGAPDRTRTSVWFGPPFRNDAFGVDRARIVRAERRMKIVDEVRIVSFRRYSELPGTWVWSTPRFAKIPSLDRSLQHMSSIGRRTLRR